MDLLRHLFGAVVGQTQAHDGQHHGYLVDGTVLWLRLHLAGNLPLEEAEVSRRQSAQPDDHVDVRWLEADGGAGVVQGLRKKNRYET